MSYDNEFFYSILSSINETGDDLDQRRALVILNGLPKVGPLTLNHLLLKFENDAVAILNASVKESMRVKGVSNVIADTITHWHDRFDVGKEESLLKKHGASIVNFQGNDYPPLLKEIYDPPISLYFLGEFRIAQPAIAVGTRRPTLYGRYVAKRLARELAQMGFCIVSGMAPGIDSEAHEGPLEAKGKTVAVLLVVGLILSIHPRIWIFTEGLLKAVLSSLNFPLAVARTSNHFPCATG